MYQPKNPDPEIEAFRVISRVMKPFSQEARDRMLRYLADRYLPNRKR